MPAPAREFGKENVFMLGNERMVDDGGHQGAEIQYPGLPREYMLEMVHKFYDEYYFRPKAVFRIVRKAAFDSTERKRLYKEAKSFLKLRAQRNRVAKEMRANGTQESEAVAAQASSQASSGD